MYEFQFDEEDYDMYEIIYADNPIKILVEDEFSKGWCPLGRRPYYQMRGKRISEEQAFEVISRTDCTLADDLKLEGSIPYYNFRNDWFGYFSLPRHGWVHPNGIVGTNSIMQKYPTVDEFAHEWAIYLYNFPFLDLIVGITWWNEMSVERYEILHSIPFNKRNDYAGYDDFYDNIEAGIWVHDRKIEIINKEKTIEVYKQYEELYEEKDQRVYFYQYYEDFQPDITTMEYFKKCLASYGITDCEEFFSQKFYPRQLERLKKIIL